MLKPKIFIPIPTGKVFIGIIRPMKQTFIAVNRTKWPIMGSLSRYLSGKTLPIVFCTSEKIARISPNFTFCQGNEVC